ncbi:transcription termination/antitermination protein NusG [Thalassotalea fusca]
MSQMQWYAIRTKPKAEIKVFQQAERKLSEVGGSQAYLPMEDKGEMLQPLFKGYVFVKHDDSGFHALKYTPGVRDYVRFSQFPTPIPEQEIELVKKMEAHFNHVALIDSCLVKGSRVKVIRGILAGREGILSQDQKGKKIAIQLFSIGKSAVLQVSGSDVVAI